MEFTASLDRESKAPAASLLLALSAAAFVPAAKPYRPTGQGPAAWPRWRGCRRSACSPGSRLTKG